MRKSRDKGGPGAAEGRRDVAASGDNTHLRPTQVVRVTSFLKSFPSPFLSPFPRPRDPQAQGRSLTTELGLLV